MQGIAQKVLADPGKYSIQQLQQGVQDGIIPAYIAIPIIQAKVQEQKQAQVAQSMQQPPARARPPVAQQVMSEARGLEALPTNLPTQYAGGGIVAFDEGGAVPRYQVGGQLGGGLYDINRDPLVNSFIATRDQQAGLVGVNPLVGQRLPGETFDAFKQRVLQADAQQRAAQQSQENQAREAQRQQLLAQRGASPFTSPFVSPTAVTPTLSATSTDQPAAAPTQTPPATGTAQQTPPATGTPGQQSGIQGLLGGLGLGGSSALGRTPGIGLQPSTLPAPPYTQSATDIFQRQVYGTEEEPGFLARSRQRQEDLDRKVAEAQGKITGKAYEGLESDLKKEAEELGADKEQAKYMAMFKAGLAIMGGDSRFALQNIGKGAMVGVEDYQLAAKDIKKAHKENQRLMAQIEQARRAEAIGDRDKAIDRLDKASQAEQKRDEFLVNGFTNAGIKDADRKLEEWKTLYGGEKAMQVADLQGRYSLAGHEVSGKYSLAGHLLSAMGKERLTPYQELRLRMDAEKQVDPMVVRNEVAKSLNLTKVPAPGVDKTFDAKVSQLYERRIAERIYGPSTGAGATPQNPYAGFKLVP